MTCALCLQERPLRRSHIVPEFMHGQMYDAKHRFFGISSIASKPNKLFQKGLREELLCAGCEQHIGRYESYASRVFYGNPKISVSPVPGGLLLKSLDYRILKLFFLSLLWRFAVTKVEQYKGADLGPYTERLRERILKEDPGDVLTFPCMVIAVTQDGKHLPDFIVAPANTRFDGQRVWNFVIAGFLFSFFLGKTVPPTELHAAFLQPEGLLFLQITEIRKIDYLYKFACEMGAAQRKRKAQRL